MHSPRILFLALAIFGLPKLGLAGAYDENDSLEFMSERDGTYECEIEKNSSQDIGSNTSCFLKSDSSGAEILELAARDRVRVKHGYGRRARPGKLSKRAGEQCYPTKDVTKAEQCKDCSRTECKYNPLTKRCNWTEKSIANRGVGCRGCKCKKYGQ